MSILFRQVLLSTLLLTLLFIFLFMHYEQIMHRQHTKMKR